MKKKLEPTERIIKLIKKWEGYSSEVYICPAGKKTIGYGHTFRRKIMFSSVTKEQAHQLLLKDLKKATKPIHKYVKVPLTQGQFDALTSLIYNVGWFAFYKSKALAYLNASEYNLAAYEFFDENVGFVYADKKKLPGLVKRRMQERKIWNEKPKEEEPIQVSAISDSIYSFFGEIGKAIGGKNDK